MKPRICNDADRHQRGCACGNRHDLSCLLCDLLFGANGAVMGCTCTTAPWAANVGVALNPPRIEER